MKSHLSTLNLIDKCYFAINGQEAIDLVKENVTLKIHELKI